MTALLVLLAVTGSTSEALIAHSPNGQSAIATPLVFRRCVVVPAEVTDAWSIGSSSLKSIPIKTSKKFGFKYAFGEGLATDWSEAEVGAKEDNQDILAVVASTNGARTIVVNIKDWSAPFEIGGATIYGYSIKGSETFRPGTPIVRSTTGRVLGFIADQNSQWVVPIEHVLREIGALAPDVIVAPLAKPLPKFDGSKWLNPDMTEWTITQEGAGAISGDETRFARFAAANYGKVRSVPELLYDRGALYALNTVGALVCFSPDTQQKRWEVEEGGSIFPVAIVPLGPETIAVLRGNVLMLSQMELFNSRNKFYSNLGVLRTIERATGELRTSFKVSFPSRYWAPGNDVAVGGFGGFATIKSGGKVCDFITLTEQKVDRLTWFAPIAWRNDAVVAFEADARLAGDGSIDKPFVIRADSALRLAVRGTGGALQSSIELAKTDTKARPFSSLIAVNSEGIAFLHYSDSIYALDTKTDARIATISFEGAASLVADDKLVCVSTNTSVLGYSPDLKQIWRADVRGPLSRISLIDEGLMFVDNSGQLVLLSRTTGAERFRADLGKPAIAQPVRIRDDVWILSGETKLVCVRDFIKHAKTMKP